MLEKHDLPTASDLRALLSAGITVTGELPVICFLFAPHSFPQRGTQLLGYQFEILYRNDSKVKNVKTAPLPFLTPAYKSASAGPSPALSHCDFNSALVILLAFMKRF